MPVKDYLLNQRFITDDQGRIVIQNHGGDGVLKFGRVTTGSASAPEDVWNAGGAYPFQDVAGAISAVSDNAADASGGTGARVIIVDGLDADGFAVSHEIALNGATSVAPVGAPSALAINRVYVDTAGSNTTNVGTITVSIGGTVVAQIDPEYGQTQQACYTVPANYDRAEVYGLYLSIVRTVSTSIIFSVDVQLPGKAWRRRYEDSALNASAFNNEFSPPIVVPPLSRIRIRAQSVSAANGVECYASFSLDQFPEFP